jgi:rhodanese-related sulfurtransferase
MADERTCTIFEATLGDSGQSTPEVSLGDFRRIVAEGKTRVVDTRKPAEFAAGHVPGACNIPSIEDLPAAESVALVERLVAGDKGRRLVLYCNGPFCKGTRRLSEQLFEAGFTNVWRFQLGIPVWRALGGPTEIELEGVIRIYGVDKTAVFFDARSPEEFSKGSLPGMHHVPLDVARAGRAALPMPRNDFNTRIVLVGGAAGEALALARILGESPFHNVTYYSGPFEALANAAKQNL